MNEINKPSIHQTCLNSFIIQNMDSLTIRIKENYTNVNSFIPCAVLTFKILTQIFELALWPPSPVALHLFNFSSILWLIAQLHNGLEFQRNFALLFQK
jgi:hypothetical protein